MRVSPLALFCYSNYEELVNVVRQSAELTHTHKQGYDGTILQVDLRCFSLFIIGDDSLTSFEFKEQV
jgi:ADP-ribosylglycohydrolase